MSEEKDYEAIGKYHVAKDELHKLLEMRGNLARAIEDIMRPLTLGSSGAIKIVNTDKLREKTNELCKVSEAIEIAIHEVDTYVSAVGGQKTSRY